LAALLLGLLLPPLPGLPLLRATAFDTYQSLHPRVPRMAPVVIVAIDEESLRQYGQWPWPRTWLARIVGAVAGARPAAIGLAILMPEPDRLSPARLPKMVAGMDADMAQRLSRLRGNDTVLAEAIRGQPVVLGVAGLESRAPEASTEVHHAPVRSIGGDPAPFLRRFEATLHSVDEIDRAAVGHGLTSVDLERGVVRRVPLLARVAERLVPSLGLEMLRVAEGGPPISVRVSAAGIQTVGVGAFVASSDPDGSAWIHYTRHDPDRFVSAADVLAAQADASLFQGRLVLIGVTALGLSDHLATPVGDHMSGVEVHAQFLENLVEGSLLSRPRFVRWIEIGWLLAGGLLLIVLVPRLPARASVGLLAVLIVAMAGFGLVLYLRMGVLLDAATPSVALALLFSMMLVVTLTETQTQRRALRRQVEQQREAAARLAGELEAARRIQMGTLPRAAAAFPGETRFDLYAMLEPAREVGGDLYDFFTLDEDHLFFLIGDVSGKGLPGSLFMAISKALYKSTALRRHGQVAVMMREADAEISRDNAEGLFVTVLAGILDARTGEVEYCSAGHEPPLLLPRGGRALQRLVEGGGRGRLFLRAGHAPPRARGHAVSDHRRGHRGGRARRAALWAGAARGLAGSPRGSGEPGRGGGGDPPRRGRLRGRHRALRRYGGPRPALHRPPHSPSPLRGEGRVRGGLPHSLYRTVISTRRFRGSATSSGVGTSGSRSPRPATRMRSAAMPTFTSSSRTRSARRSESVSL
jgi:CHASE2 domain-containing sensor protein